MKLTFLAASDGTPLSKAYFQTPNGLEVFPYPNVGLFNSQTIDVPSLEHAAVALELAGAEGQCLLKGHTDRDLNNESRAGSTSSTTPTDFIVLDLDIDSGFADIEDFLAQIGLADTSYILHHSSSSGIVARPGLRAHVIMRLAQPTVPALLKLWLQHLNLSIPALRERCRLSANQLGLRWALDVTTCQNDKLIFIADPIVDGITDPMAGKRFEYRPRATPTAQLDLTRFNTEALRTQTDELINELRKAQGMKRVQPRYGKFGHEEILLNPGQATITGVREARGFTYLNLNGGDSWAYYFPSDNPELLFNFKGEPPVRLKDIAPDFYRDITRKPSQDALISLTGEQRWVLRHNPTDKYYTVIHDPGRNRLELAACARTHLQDFMDASGQPMPNPIPMWDIEYDPTRLDQVDHSNSWINTFVPSRYLLNPTAEFADLPPIINRIITSVCGDCDRTKEWFLNWLSFIFQTRTKPKTAILFHGVEGTGKGLLFHEIIRPLLGPGNCMMIQQSALNDGFNEWVGRTVVLAIDEFKVTDKDAGIQETLRNLITEELADVRAMRTDRRQVMQHLAVMIFTNHPDAFRVPASDRRYTIAPRQERRLIITEAEIERIPDELPAFAAYLHEYKVNVPQVRFPLETESKNDMRLAAEGTGDRILRAVAEGDLQFFINYINTNEAIPDPSSLTYERIIRGWCALPGPADIPEEDIRQVYMHLTDGKITKVGFGRRARTHLPHHHDGKYRITFKPPTRPLTANVTPIRKVL